MNGKKPSFEIVNGTEIFDNLYRTILYCTGSPDNNGLDSRFGAAVCFYFTNDFKLRLSIGIQNRVLSKERKDNLALHGRCCGYDLVVNRA